MIDFSHNNENEDELYRLSAIEEDYDEDEEEGDEEDVKQFPEKVFAAPVKYL